MKIFNIELIMVVKTDVSDVTFHEKFEKWLNSNGWSIVGLRPVIEKSEDEKANEESTKKFKVELNLIVETNIFVGLFHEGFSKWLDSNGWSFMGVMQQSTKIEKDV